MMDLQINIKDIFSFITEVFSTLWPLIAVILAIIFAPRIMNFTRLAFDEHVTDRYKSYKRRKLLKKVGLWKW